MLENLPTDIYILLEVVTQTDKPLVLTHQVSLNQHTVTAAQEFT